MIVGKTGEDEEEEEEDDEKRSRSRSREEMKECSAHYPNRVLQSLTCSFLTNYVCTDAVEEGVSGVCMCFGGAA